MGPLASAASQTVISGLGDPELDGARLLEAWEAGLDRSAPDRCLLMLEACWPGTSFDDYSVGTRDRLLLIVRERKFGPVIEACAGCPSCGERLDVSFGVRDILVPERDPHELKVSEAGYQVTFRLPTSADLMHVSRLSLAGDETPLLTRCLLSARRKGRPVGATELPGPVREAIGRRMAEADPQADVEIAVACASCGHEWSLPFDIGCYLWEEVDDWAQRMLGAVHLLAMTYGWTEREVLRLSDHRRHLYLEMAQA